MEARKKGLGHVELPAKGFFAIKPDKFKVRVACGNKTAETYGKVSATDLDTAMMGYLPSWGASAAEHAIASLDVTGKSCGLEGAYHHIQATAFTSGTCLACS